MDAPARFSVYRSEGRLPPLAAGETSLHEHMGVRTGAQIAAGLVAYRDREVPWTVWYDEVLICHRVDGEFELEVDGVAHPMRPGDMAWIPAGTSLIYRARGEAVVFYAVTPADWWERRPS